MAKLNNKIMNDLKQSLANLCNEYKSKISDVLREHNITGQFLQLDFEIPEEVIEKIRNLRKDYEQQKKWICLNSFKVIPQADGIPTVGQHSDTDLVSKLPKNYTILFQAPFSA